MTSILLAESMSEDGSVHDEQVMSDTCATVFLGKLIDCTSRTL